MNTLQKILGLGSMVPGPQQPFVAGGALALGLGQDIKNRQDDDYRDQNPLWQMLVGMGGQAVMDKADPMRMLMMKLKGVGAKPPMMGDFPGAGGPFYG